LIGKPWSPRIELLEFAVRAVKFLDVVFCGRVVGKPQTVGRRPARFAATRVTAWPPRLRGTL